MKTEAIFVTCLSVLNSCVICKPKRYRPQSHIWREYAYDKEINMAGYDIITTSLPEVHNEMIPLARHMLHNAEWASNATISTLPYIKGLPFSNLQPMVDGPVDRSSGIPYFYFSSIELTSKNLKLNKNATVLVTYDDTIFCERVDLQAKPLCTRLLLSGKMKKVTNQAHMGTVCCDGNFRRPINVTDENLALLKNDTPFQRSLNFHIDKQVKRGTAENAFAKNALFSRHPSLVDYPSEYNWYVAKLKIAHIALIDWIGDIEYISVEDYLEYNYKEIKQIDDDETY